MSARTPLLPFRSASRAGRPTDDPHPFSASASLGSCEMNPMISHKPLNLSTFKRPDAKKDTGTQDLPENFFTFQSRLQPARHIASPTPHATVAVAAPALGSKSIQMPQPTSSFKPGNIFRVPSLPTPQDDDHDRTASLPTRSTSKRFFGGQALDKISEVIEPNDSGFSESGEVLGDLPVMNTFTKTASKHPLHDDDHHEHLNLGLSKRQRRDEEPHEYELPQYDDRFRVMPLGQSTPPRHHDGDDGFSDPFKMSIEQYIAENQEEYEAFKQRWANCTLEEWIDSGIGSLLGLVDLDAANELQEVIKRFEDVVDFMKEHMVHKMTVFTGIDKIFETYTEALANRKQDLRGAQDTLGKGLGNILGCHHD